MPNISDTPAKDNAPAETAGVGPRAATATTSTTPGAATVATSATTTTGAQSAATAVATATNVVTLTPANPTTTTPTSAVAVTVPNTTGTVTFSLVVTDNLGVKSAPAFATVTIQAAPKAALTATPTLLTEGGPIQLSGAGSTTSGSIASYLFSLVPPTNPLT